MKKNDKIKQLINNLINEKWCPLHGKLTDKEIYTNPNFGYACGKNSTDPRRRLCNLPVKTIIDYSFVQIVKDTYIK